MDPAGLQPGQYTGTIQIIAPSAGNSPLQVPVTLTVSAAPTLIATPSSVSVTYRQLDPTPGPVTVSVTSSGSPLTFTTSVSPATPWLAVSGGGQTPRSLQITINPSGLAPGVYRGGVILSSAQAGNNPLVVPVTLTVAAGAALVAQPSEVDLSLTQGSTTRATAQLAISSDSALSFTATVQTSSGGNWLAVQPASTQTPAALTVTAQAGSLAPGTYNGTIALTSPQATNSPLSVPVSLTISAQPELRASPRNLTFSYQLNSGPPPPPETLTISTSNGASAPVTAIATTNSGGDWLTVSGGITAPGSLPVSVNPTGLSPGIYAGTITLTSPGYASIRVLVSLRVTPAPILIVQPASLSFASQPGGAAPPAQTVTVSSGKSTLQFSASASSGTAWLNVTGGGQTPGTVSVSVNPAGLAPGKYTESVVLTSAQAGNSPLLVPVTLTVALEPIIFALPASLSFSYTQHDAVPPAQTVSVASSQPINFSTSVSPGASWLAVTGPGTTPATLTVTVNPTSLAPGNYNASIIIDAPTAADSPLIISVGLTVTVAPLMVPSRSQFVFASRTTGGLPPNQTLVVDSSGTPLVVTGTTSTSAGGSWLSVTGGGSTPASLSLTVNPSGLQPATYPGSVTLSSQTAGNSPLVLPVSLVVTSTPLLQSSIDEIEFAYQLGQAPPPDTKILVTSSGAPVPFQASGVTDSGGAWLRVSGGSRTPGVVTVGVDPTGVGPGTYTGGVTLTSDAAGNSPLTIPVTLTVASSPTLTATPRGVRFVAQQNGPPPPSQVVHVTSGSSPVAVSYTVSPGSTWLTVSGPASTPADLTLTVSTAGLSPRRYAASVIVQSTAAANIPIVIPVVLDLSAAPALQVSPAVLRFSYEIGQAKPPAQTLSVTSSSTQVDFTASIVGEPAWLFASGSGQTPGTVQVTVDPGGLGAGIYAGAILITSTTASPVLTPVILTVSSAPSLAASPSALAFAWQVGGPAPAASEVVVTSTGRVLSVTPAAQTFSGGDWLAISQGGNTPLTVIVTPQPSGLAPGVYQGQISTSASGAANSPLLMPVTLSVTSAATLTATPASLSFDAPVNGPAPPNQQVVLGSSNSQPLPLTAPTTQGESWLTAALGGTTTPATLTVAVNPAGMPAGMYQGSVTVSSPAAGNSPVVVPVRLNVSALAILSVYPASAAFAYTVNGPAPAPIPITISSTGGPVNFAVSVSSGSPWLSVAGSGPTPATILLTVVPVGLAPGSYHATVLVSSSGASNSLLSIPVDLTVTAAPVLSGSPPALLFRAGGVQSQILRVTSSGQPVTVAVSSSEPWLAAQGGGATPQNVQVSVNPSGLPPGVYQGSLLITAAGAGNSPLNVRVRLEIAQPQTLQANPAGVSFVYNSPGPVPSAQTVNLTLGSQPATEAHSAVGPGAPWLSVAGSGATIAVSANPAGLASGIYSGNILVEAASASNSPLTVPVTLTIVGGPVINISQTAVAIAARPEEAGPISRTVTLDSVGNPPVSFTLDLTTSTWLTATPLSGSTPAAITLTADPTGLRAGDYAGEIAVLSAGQKVQSIAVAFRVPDFNPGATVNVSPALLVFSHHQGEQEPEPVTMYFGRTVPGFEITASSQDPWISLRQTLPEPSAPVEVSVLASGLAGGAYRGSIALTLVNSSSEPVAAGTVPVELYVDQPSDPKIFSIVSSMSFLQSPLSPGMMFTVFGAGMRPASPVGAQVAGGSFPRTFAGVQVLVNGILCPLLYVSESQINALAPYALYTHESATVVVQYLGAKSNEVPVNVASSAPGLFSSSQAGTGQGSILNQDLSVNSSQNPASKGSIVALFGGGAGQTDPQGVDGILTPTDSLSHPKLPVSVTIGGIDAEVTYAGDAPLLVSGALQVNARIPISVPSGSVPVIVKVGQVSQQGLTVSVR